jgi:ABC-type cobalamin/Fe3+-siderophores transport system ATPase subunit
MAMIECQKITLSYGSREVLSDFSAQCEAGTITAILGANGSGKSTLLAALAGDIAPSTGSIALNGREINRYSVSELSRLRAVAAQIHQYWMAFTTSQILRLGNEEVSERRFKYLVEKLNLNHYLEQAVTTLSGGQLQRIEIARALLRELPVVMLDEPFASQDLTSIEAIKELLMEERSAGRVVVVVAHARREDLAWCDQIIELRAR